MREPGREPLVERLDGNSNGGPERLDERTVSSACDPCSPLSVVGMPTTTRSTSSRLTSERSAATPPRTRRARRRRAGGQASRWGQRSRRRSAPSRSRGRGPSRRGDCIGRELRPTHRPRPAHACFESADNGFASVPARAHSVRLPRAFGRNGEGRTQPRRNTVDRRLPLRVRIALLPPSPLSPCASPGRHPPPRPSSSSANTSKDRVTTRHSRSSMAPARP